MFFSFSKAFKYKFSAFSRNPFSSYNNPKLKSDLSYSLFIFNESKYSFSALFSNPLSL